MGSPRKKIILVGGFHETLELCEACGVKVAGIIDNQLTGELRGVPVIGKDTDAPRLYRKFGAVPVVLTPDQPGVRMKLRTYYSEIGFSFAGLVHPSANVSPSAQLGKGAVVQAGVTVSSEAVIGDFVKLNVGAVVMHDCVIGDYTSVAPCALLLGHVRIGRECYVGGHATILPYRSVADRVTVGAGAVVTKDVGEEKIVKGVPAR